MSDPQVRPGSSLSRTIRRLSVPIILVWLAIAAITNVTVPQLEVVGKEQNVSLSPSDAPSLQAMERIGDVFDEFDSDSAAMIVLEGDEPLGADAHVFYDELVQRLLQDTEHVEHVQDFWGDPLTAAGSQSPDGKAAYVQVYLRGNQGEALSLESVDAVRDILAETPAPIGVKAYVTGAAPVIADQFEVGSESTDKVTAITFLVIALMLFFVFRSVVTTVLALVMVLIEVAAARGVVAALAHSGVIGLSTYSTNLLTLLVIAAGTDYAIFFLGRCHEARLSGQEREASYHTMFAGTAHVVLGSGLTIAGAVACLSFTRLPYFQTLGIPAAIGILVALAAALTLSPAIITAASLFGLLEPKRKIGTRGWRRIGTAIVRWPGPVFVVASAAAMVGMLALPGYQPNYDMRPYLPDDAPANIGYAAAERHFSPAKLNPELLMIETDHDLRNPADFLILEKVAKAILYTPGIAQVQSITRPLGTPIKHSSIPFQISMQSASQIMNLKYQQDSAENLLKQVSEIDKTIALLGQQMALQQQAADATAEQAAAFNETVATVTDLRDKIANFDDFFRPLRNYFYWEPHCFDIPVCWALRSIFDAIDGINALTEHFGEITASLDSLNALQPKLVALIPPQIASQEVIRELTSSNYSTQAGILDQTAAAIDNATAMGEAFDTAKNDDSFYLPPEAFDNPDFQRGLKLFLSPDGRAARMIITHEGEPAGPEAIANVDAIKQAAKEAVKATPLANAHFYLAGTAATYKDIQDGARYDLLIAAISALSLILLVIMMITRSLVAALVIVGTVAVSLGTAFGMSVLLWQYLLGIELYWVVLALAIIVLLGVGSDYNLLLISRFKEERDAGLQTGIIRAMGSTGGVVTAAGLVFAATMATFMFSDLMVLAQVGTTIALGLLFDTLLVRAFLTPSIAALLGRWFWWPQRVRTRPASHMLRPYGSRPLVRALLQREPKDAG